MNSQISKDIIRDLRSRFNITDEQAKEIIKSQFRKLRKSMAEYNYEEKNYPSVRLINFGLFFVKPSKKNDYGIQNTKSL